MTRTCLIVIAVFVVLRSGLEAFGPDMAPTFYQPMEMSNISNELSFTRLLLILPVFLGSVWHERERPDGKKSFRPISPTSSGDWPWSICFTCWTAGF